jgi:hypothetical protein
VQSAELYGDVTRSQVRAALTQEAQETLHLFAHRRVVLGRRTSNVAYFHQALSALSLLPTVDDIPWSTWFLAALFLGDYADDSDIVNLFEGSQTAGGIRCATLQRSLKNGCSLAQCHLVEVSTTYGIGMLELPHPEDIPAGGYLSAPIIDRDDARYAPTVNLAQVAVDVADALDKLERTTTSNLEFLRLEFGTVSAKNVLGCLRFCAFFENVAADVYVGEMRFERDATILANDVSQGEGVAISKGNVLILFMPQPNFNDDEVETPELDAEGLTTLASGMLSKTLSTGE